MKKIVIILGAFCLFTLTVKLSFAKENEKPLIKPRVQAQSATLDRIVAIVNDDVITGSEFNKALNMVKMQFVQQRMALPSEAVLKKQVLEQLINKQLQLQVAKQVGISVSDEDLDQAIKNIAEQNHMTVKAVYARIHQDGLSATTYRHEMREQMIVQKLQQQEVVHQVSVTPDEVNNFMHSKLWQNNSAKEYHIEDILIPLPDAPSSEQIATARRRAEIVMQQLKSGQNFHDLAQSESSGKLALQGGDLGWRKLPEIPSAFAEQVAHLQSNETAGPIQAPNGFHIIRLAGVRADQAKQATPDKKQVENLLLQRKFEEAVQNWVSKLRSQAFVKSMLS